MSEFIPLRSRANISITLVLNLIVATSLWKGLRAKMLTVVDETKEKQARSEIRIIGCVYLI
jgi:hypothetical protein